jgi:predicted Zn-dependent protease
MRDYHDIELSRREFLILSSAATLGVMSGCATNPVTGKQQLMFYSRQDELDLDKQYVPHQISADYGAVLDSRLNDYIGDIGRRIVGCCDRPDMPYRFRCVNASYINAYAFPGGNIATTRGILLMMENEAQLASVIAHEVAHVCARHTSERMTKGLVLTGALIGAGLLAEKIDKDITPWVMGLGHIGSGLLLCRYSRDDERQADKIGMKYMAAAGFNPNGMAEVMDGFRKEQKRTPGLLDRLYSTHPMSEDRYLTAIERAKTNYPDQIHLSPNREHYMDMTAGLRKIRGVIEAIQKGDEATNEKKLDLALLYYGDALRKAPDDYEILLKTANCHLARQLPKPAVALIQRARQAYPAEPQALHLYGMTQVMTGRFGEALQSFQQYETMLPGNPYILFYLGRSHEGLGRQAEAAGLFQRFLSAGGEGREAEHARMRLQQWGFAERATG